MNKLADEEPNERGDEKTLASGALPEILSPHLRTLIKKTGGKSGPIGLQFMARPKLENLCAKTGYTDPLNEEDFEVAPGLIYKYTGDKNKPFNYGRALWLVTDFCRSYCRFCTRGRRVGLTDNMSFREIEGVSRNAILSDEEINETLTYISEHEELREVILSGGDPMYTSRAYLTKLVEGLVRLQKKGKVNIIRIGTRLPVHNPSSFKDWHYTLVKKIKNPYIMVHINHPAELTRTTLEVLNNFRSKCMATVMSQTVLLKGVNDNEETLLELFFKLAAEGIRPYYVYQNDPVYWSQHFTVPIDKAISLWSKLRPKLSGVAATARFVIDVPLGFGKVPIPEGEAWDVDYKKGFKDFKGQEKPLVAPE